jgi:hypothetical protein
MMVSVKPKKTPNEWLATDLFRGVVVMDPDGWDRKNYDVSWAEPITEIEMHMRLGQSTCMYPSDFFRPRGEVLT